MNKISRHLALVRMEIYWLFLHPLSHQPGTKRLSLLAILEETLSEVRRFCSYMIHLSIQFNYLHLLLSSFILSQ